MKHERGKNQAQNSHSSVLTFAFPACYQILRWCWCSLKRKMWFLLPIHIVLSDPLPGNEDGNSWIPHGNIRTEVLAIFLAFLRKRTLCSLVASKELTVTGSVLFNYLVATGKCCCWGVQFWADKFWISFQILKDQNKTLQAEVQKLQALLSEPVQPTFEVVSNVL